MSRILPFFSFLVFYFFEVLKSNFTVARDVLRPSLKMKPGIIAVCLLYTSPSPRDGATSRMPSSA